jgi:lipoprotein-anchoring transpeptidase ErfK/SrfK
VGVIMKNPCKARLAMPVIAAAFIVAAFTPARADVVVQIDKSAQRMSVSVDGVARYNWPVSTGRDGYARQAAPTIRRR